MGLIWNRVAELAVGIRGTSGILFDQSFKIEFIIKKTSNTTPNVSTIRIYNLKESSQDFISQPNLVAILKAGHEEDTGLVTIFDGDILNATTYEEGADKITELEVADGYTAIKNTVISLGFAPGVPATTILTAISASMGLALRPLPPIKPRNYPNGFSFIGEAWRAMDKVCEYLGAEWSIQNNEIQVLLEGGVVLERATVLSENIIGSPQPTSKTYSNKRASQRGVIGKPKTVQIVTQGIKKFKVFGYKVDAYILPYVQPGSYIQLDSKNVTGYFRVESLVHRGDTYGRDWKTSLELRTLELALEATPFDGDILNLIQTSVGA